MVQYANDLILFLYINEIVGHERKHTEKLRGYTYKITNISDANYPRIASLKSYKTFNLGFDIKQHLEVSKDAKIRIRYNQVPHPTQDTNGKVTSLRWTTAEILVIFLDKLLCICQHLLSVQKCS